MILVSAMQITAGVYVNDAEDGLIQDIDEWMERLAPFRDDYRHHRTGETNGDSHLKSLLVHHEVIIPVTNAKIGFRALAAGLLCREHNGIGDWRCLMALKSLLGLDRPSKPLTTEEGLKILERDRYRCQYCGLDGLAQFENSLIMSVDFIVPRARKGKKDASNLVSACRPCNLVKGRRVFKNLEEARAYVLQRRDELRKDWEQRVAQIRTKSATL